MPKLPKGIYRVSITTDEIQALGYHYADAINKLVEAIADQKSDIIKNTLIEKRDELQARLDEIQKFTDGRRNNKPPKRKKNNPASTELPFNENDEK